MNPQLPPVADESEALAELLLGCRWPDGGFEGMPTRRTSRMIARHLLASDWLSLHDAAVAAGERERLGAREHVEWGIERSLPQVKNGEPYIEWRGWVGHDGYRVDYTAESVWSLASGRPVYRRTVTTFANQVGEPELVTRSQPEQPTRDGRASS